MRKFFIAVSLLLLATGLCVAQTTSPKTKEKKDKTAEPSDKYVLLSEVVKEVENALDAYQADPTLPDKTVLPKLATADFDFKTVSDVKSGINVSFLIISIKYTHDKQKTNDVEFEYAPQTVFGLDQEKPKSFQQELIDTIKAAANAVMAERAAGGAKDPLTLQKLTVTISFGVTKDGSVGATIPIHLVTIGPSLEGSVNTVQQVKLTFGKSPKA